MTIKLSTQLVSNDKIIPTKDSIENIALALSKIGIYIASLHQLYDYDSIVSSISKALDELSSVLINAGCNGDYIKAYKTWAKFGWSFNASVSIKFFLTAPDSLQEADCLMQKYCNSEEVTKMLDELISAGINQKDLEEAYFDYINKKYKSSVMLLFSLIDGLLISRKFFNESGRLKTGAGVVGELKKNAEIHKESTHFHYLKFILIIHCLITLFQNSENFEKEPLIINRNFLIHGMRRNEVSEIDCLKIWSALYSFAVIYPGLENEI